MSKNTAVVQFAVPSGLTDQDFFETIKKALARGLPHDAKLTNVVVQDAVIFEPGEELLQIRPAAEPAAAGEAKTLNEVLEAERFFYLNQRARDRLEMVLNNFMENPLVPERVRVLSAQLSQVTNTVVARVQYPDGFIQRYSQTLLPGTIVFILGEDENWDPTKT